MLVASSYRASVDPFVKVRGMLEDMLATLLQGAAEETTQKAFGDKDISESKKSQADIKENLAEKQSRIDKGDPSVASS